ncbi:LysR family transcriptional regulator ArgP [Neorhizobium galegae]|uniref:Transcriptional regulator, ArgP family n=1 Tax=Neorhizobium galegae bv. officinalis bv. officinalis str. HAMBI 1141 TaxID=1028801 RepID=A0A068TJV0_NEOGA|nr:LysR family transcriptional regulator ArgP [Neorhizobium galegae]CDZ30269.1 Transcriptional regulator, ArgP family [Neorhizobium galegae bv. officinalis]KAA9382376.1 LysR family transcriptional regulator ArgP [Neorhizobium galegae]KAB1108825.1 LysR family transcriptional regulator ArgP [Neorhizobium galegae]MCM2501702.1 LysR family transcriptional regulator ArgP [Neorhizobium galegae]MCQ1766752.1 LysR family transcriptional regulator ArgP [Neorhizobium galegae]
MIDYTALRVLHAVIQSGSFEKAATVLNVTPSAVSQRVKQLEERVGAALVVRGTPCVATEKGDQLCSHMENVGILEHDLLKELPSLADPHGPQQRVTLRIATNADSLGTWFLEAMAEFSKSSDYLLNLSVDDQDYTSDWLQQGKVIAAVSGSDKPISGCRRFPLGALRYHATASPGFITRRFAGGVTPETLADAPSLTFDQKDRLQSDWVRQTLGESVSLPTHWLPSTQSFVEASLMGMGWGMNPIQLVRDHLEAGRLVELLPGKTLDVPLYWHINRLAADRLNALTRCVSEVAGRTLIRME